MTIVILIQNLRIGGMQRVVVDQANELHARGHRVVVVTFEVAQNEGSMQSLLLIPREQVLYIPYPRLRSVRGLRTLVHTLKTAHPDILITHHWFANTVGRAALFFVKVPKVLSFEHSIEDSRRRSLQFFMDRVLQYKSSFVIAVSEAVRASLIRHGIHAQHIRVISNGIVLGTPRTEPGVGNRFIFIGRLVRDKGADLAMFALARVPGALLTIVGDGPERIQLQKQAEQLGVASRTSFVGFSMNPLNELMRADALIMPSRREGFGIAAVEALSIGVPIIASDVVGAHGFIQNEVNGLVVSIQDSDALARAMKRFMEEASLREKLASNASKSLETYSIKTHIDTLLSL